MSDADPAVPAIRRRPAYLIASTATVLWLGAIVATVPLVAVWKAEALAGGGRAQPAASVFLVRAHDTLLAGLCTWLPCWLVLQAIVVLAQDRRVPKALRLGLLVGASVIPGIAGALLILALALLAAA